MADTTIIFPDALEDKMDNDPTGGYPNIRFSAGSGLEFEAIHLYIPQGLQFTDGANYSGVDLGTINAAASGVKSLTSAQVEAEAEGATVSTDAVIAATLGTADLLGVDSSISGKVGIDRGVALNPQTALAFDRVNMRQFQFSFVLVPESVKEQRKARLIENFFRKYMYPETQGFVSKYPPKFKIQFLDGAIENPYMPMIYESFLTGVDVTINPEGNSYHVGENTYYAPTSIGLNLAFQEARMLSRHDLYKKDVSAGFRMYDYSRPGQSQTDPGTAGD